VAAMALRGAAILFLSSPLSLSDHCLSFDL
jgi:hypothetical protein